MAKNVLVLIDIQKEYITEDRQFFLRGIEPSLKQCHELLKFARENDWEIAHVQHSNGNEAARFNPQTPYFDFIDGFTPKANEEVFIKNLYSCFSNENFCKFIAIHKNDTIYLIGYNSIMCCLSTVIDGYHRGYRFILVEDATYAKAAPEYSEEDMHRHAISIINTAKYAATIKTIKILNRQS